MAKDRKKLIHIHSSIADKQPTPQSLAVGEIAVNNAADQEFLSIKNSEDKVKRFSSDEQMITWMEKKEVMPYVGYVRGGAGPSATSAATPTADNYGSYGILESDLSGNTSEIVIKLNQVAASATTKHERVNGSKDRYDKDVNPTTDSGVNDGAGFFIDMSRYAMQGANPEFSGITNTCYTNLNGTTRIKGVDGACGSLLDITVNSAKTDIETANTEITSATTVIGTNTTTISGNTTLNVSGTTTETKKGNVTETNLADKQESTSGNSYNNVKLAYSGTTGGTTTEVKVGNVTESHSGTTTENKKGDVTENNLANKTENTTGNVVVNTTGTTTETKVGNVTENHSGTTTDNNKGNVTVNNQANFTMNTSGTTTFTTTGDTVIHSDGAVGITAVEDIVATSSESSIIVTANDDLCETAGDVAAFKGVNKTNVGIDCSDAGQTTTLNLNGTTINETGTTVNISGSTAANVSGATVVVSGNTTNVSGATTLNLSGKTVNVDATDIDVDASNNYCLSAATKANIYGKETNIGVECGGTTATTINVSGTTINEGGTTLNENFQDYDINASKTYCVSAATNANFYGKETNIGVDCGGTTATTINVSGTTINEGGTTNNNNFTTINNTATTINNKTTNFNVTGTTYISGDTTISGTTTIGNTLIIKEGLEKKLSWSYGDVKSAASGSTNFKSDASFVIPKCVSDINRKKLKITHNGNGDASYDPGSDCDNAETTITLTHKTLSTKYGENVTGRTNTDFNTSADETIYIPTSVKNLSNWNGTCYEFDGPLCITGTVTASGAIYSSDKNLKENIKSIDAEDINKVGAIDLKSFNFIDDESKTKVYGVIAQEVQEAGLDILVHQKEDGMLGVDYTSFLILKIAQLQRDNNNLVNFVASLDKRVKELEEKLEKKD